MFIKMLSVLFFIVFIATFCAPFFLADADNETEVPIHTHTDVSHGWAACIPGKRPLPSVSGGDRGSGCFSVTQCLILYSVTVTHCTHGMPGGGDCNGGCTYDVSDPDEHRRWCNICKVHYYYCAERHSGGTSS